MTTWALKGAARSDCDRPSPFPERRAPLEEATAGIDVAHDPSGSAEAARQPPQCNVKRAPFDWVSPYARNA